MDTPSINPKYFDAQQLDQTIDRLAGLMHSNDKMLLLLDADDPVMALGLQIKAECEKLTAKLIEARLATI